MLTEYFIDFALQIKTLEIIQIGIIQLIFVVMEIPLHTNCTLLQKEFNEIICDNCWSDESFC